MVKEKDVETDDEKVLAEAKSLGINKSRVSLSGFKSKKGVTLAQVEKEEIRVKKRNMGRLAKKVEKAKAKVKMKPIDKRKALLVSRFKAIKSKQRAHTYTDKNIRAWLEELKMIDSNPKSWIKLTKNGTAPFIPGNRKKKTAREILDGMDLD